MGCRAADRQLDESIIAAVLAEQFPEFGRCEVMSLGSGWDHDILVVDHDWAFRFPRHRERVAWQEREVRVAALAREALDDVVPHCEHRGEPSERFPYPFVGYRLLPGLPADEAGLSLETVARDVGQALGRVHQIETHLIPQTPEGWEEERGLEPTICESDLAAVRELLPADHRDALEDHLRRPRLIQRSAAELRFCHNDVCAEHVLVGTDGHLAGLIDWTDAMVTDPVVDFAGLITIGDWHFVAQALANYPLSTSADFIPRLQRLTRSLTVQWLSEAVRNRETADRHLIWVGRAFEQWPPTLAA